MVLSVGSQRMGSTFSVQSQDGEKYLVETTSSSGAVETQTLIWVSDTHFRLTDPVGDTMDFVRP